VDRPHRRHEHFPDRVRGHRRGRNHVRRIVELAGLFAAQIMMIVARAVYCAGELTLVSQLPANAAADGELNAVTRFGADRRTVGAGQ